MEIHTITAFLAAFLTASAWFITTLECDYMEAKQQLQQLRNDKIK
jgi:hypothetical protein